MNLRSPTVLTLIGVGATGIVTAAVVVVLLQFGGGAKAVSDNAALIGALVALGGVFTAQMVSIALEDQRTQESRSIEERRTGEARNLEAQRAREAALQNYFERVGELLIEKPLRRASPGDNLSTVVRAQTLSVLEGLDPDRKLILLLFLYESGLIYRDKPVVSLAAADLSGANLSGTRLRWADLSEANLREANLRGTDLGESDLNGADLNEADLSGAHLVGDLSVADLRGANLSEAQLGGARLRWADLREANLRMANLRWAFLSGAFLSGANLGEADLRGANLRGADLRGADLRMANLSEANLRGVKGWTEEQLAQAESLKGATKPDGQKYEDWLKDREDRKEDVENGGRS